MTPVVGGLLGYFVLGLPVPRTVAGDRTDVEAPRVQAGDFWAEIMVVNGLTDVELVDLEAMYFVSVHRHVRSPDT